MILDHQTLCISSPVLAPNYVTNNDIKLRSDGGFEYSTTQIELFGVIDFHRHCKFCSIKD
jgi:hypothetical protein